MEEKFQSVDLQSSLPLPAAGSLSLCADAMDWQECGAEGFLVKPLMEDPASGSRTWLMKIEPGAYSPPHAHTELEQVYMLDGSFYDEDRSYGPGDFIVRAPGAMHTAGSDKGAIMLVTYTPDTAAD